MHDRVYRGTSLQAAEDEEFATGDIHGKAFTNYEGWMDPESTDGEYDGEYVENLPWEVGPPEADEQAVAGGISDRLGAAQTFAKGAIPLVFHLDRSQIPDLVDVGYHYDFYDAFEGALAWVDGSATGELRVNGELMGLLAENDGRVAIKYWGQSLRDRARQYQDEMEKVITGSERVPVEGATDAVVTYTRRPMANLTALDGYYRIESSYAKDDPDAVVVREWDDERILAALYDELRERVPNRYDAYVVHVERMLVQASWGYREEDVNAVYDGNGRTSPENAPEFLLGD